MEAVKESKCYIVPSYSRRIIVFQCAQGDRETFDMANDSKCASGGSNEDIPEQEQLSRSRRFGAASYR